MANPSSLPPMSADEPALCKNCGAPLAGPFCAQCGQEARRRIVPFPRFAAETLREFFSFDTRFLRTLWALFRRPGFLTNEYVAGRRVRFMPPLRFYLLASFLFFFLVTLIRLDFSGFRLLDPPPEELAETEAAAAAAADSVAADVETAASSDSLATRETARRDTSITFDLAYRFGHRLGRASKKASENRTAFESSLLNRLPPLIFLMLPVFALLLKALYLNNRIYYAQHFIFALHLHAFAFLVMLALFLVDAVGLSLQIGTSDNPRNLIGPIFLLLLNVYLFLAMRRVYGQGRGKTVLKLFLLMSAYQLVLAIVLGLVVLISLLML